MLYEVITVREATALVREWWAAMPRVPLNMPKMSMTMEFGTIVEWLVGPGDKISNGDAVVVVTTDKVDMEVEATFDGVMESYNFV